MVQRKTAPGPIWFLLPVLLLGAFGLFAMEFSELTRASKIGATVPGIGRSVVAATRVPETTRTSRALAGSPAVLVRQGRPASTIVVRSAVGADGGLGDRRAAELLQEWIERLTGARLQIADRPGSGVPILVGRAAIDAGLEVDDIDSRSREGVRVRVEGDRVLLAGQSGNARVRAAAVLLEHLGCRWYMEGDLGKHCPDVDTLTLDPVEITDRPGFLYRRIWSGDGWARDTAWKAWNGSGGLPLQMGHDWHMIRPEDFEEHPEWFAMDADGERHPGPWLNTGNPELRRVFAERLIDSMRPGEHPSISPPDSYRFDHSPASTRYDDPDLIEPSSGNVSMSNRFMDFANYVAARVGRAYPESILNFYAYSDYSLAPTLIDELEPNLAIWIAPIRFSRFHRLGSPDSPSRQELMSAIEGWARVASMLGYRTYNYNLAESMTPFAKLTTWKHDIPWLARRNFVGMSIESFPTWDLSVPTIYLSIRLAYSPLADADAILDDFYRNFYGPAESAMREYWETVDAGWQGLETESGSVYSVHLVFTPERMRRLDAALRSAERAVAGYPLREARVAMARTAYLHAADFLAVREAMHEGRIEAALAAYRRWHERTQASIDAGQGHVYNRHYLRRFVGRYVEGARDALHPDGGAARELVAVLPDRMTLAYESDLEAAGRAAEPLRERASSGHWQEVRTFGATLDQQGLPDRLEVMWYRVAMDVDLAPRRRHYLHFSTVDGTSTLWVNGQPVTVPGANPDAPDSVAVFPALAPFTVEVTELLRAGGNRIAVRVDHGELRELSLGGIVGPVYLLSE